MSDFGDFSLKLGSVVASLSNPSTILGGDLVNQVQNQTQNQNQSCPYSTQDAVSPNLDNGGLGEVNGVKTPLPISQYPEPEVTPTTTTPKRGRPKKGSESDHRSMVVDPEKTPDWLPEGWTVVTRIRPGGKTAGTKDTYYREPVNNRQFRSKREVLEYMATGGRPSPRKKQKTIEDAGSSLPATENPNPTMTFRREEEGVPVKVKWVKAEGGNEWTPFIAGQMVPPHIQKEWAAMFLRGAYR